MHAHCRQHRNNRGNKEKIFFNVISLLKDVLSIFQNISYLILL